MDGQMFIFKSLEAAKEHAKKRIPDYDPVFQKIEIKKIPECDEGMDKLVRLYFDKPNCNHQWITMKDVSRIPERNTFIYEMVCIGIRHAGMFGDCTRLNELLQHRNRLIEHGKQLKCAECGEEKELYLNDRQS